MVPITPYRYFVFRLNLRSMTTHYADGFLFLPIVNNKIINKIDSSCKTPDFFEMKEYNISETKVTTVVTVHLQ